MKPSRADLTILSRFPKFKDTYPGLSYAPRMPGRMVREAQEALAVARKFRELELSDKPIFFQYMPQMEAILFAPRNLMYD